MRDENRQDPKQANLLYDFFKHHEDPLSNQEENSLTPILNALKGPETRYGASDFIAEGGEKRIFRVYDQYLNRHVALAKPSVSKTGIDQERFLREGQLTANLTHPNIVPIHNMGINTDGLPFFTMELIPGDSLGDIIDNLKKEDPKYSGRYDQKALLSIFNKVCDAMSYAHSRNVIHLDIKPDNIRIGKFGEVLLCDWGLALVGEHIEDGEAEPGQLDGDILNDMTLTGTIKGTPGFMAPEQILNTGKTHLSDIYALGAILYFMITFRLPVDGDNHTERMKNTRNGNIVPIRKRKTKNPVPSGLASISMKALSYAPDKRYENVLALQNDINRFLTGYPAHAERLNILNRTLMLVLRHRKLSTWLLSSLILLTAVMGIDNQMIKNEKETAITNLSLFMQEQEKSKKMYDKLTQLSLASQNVQGFADAKAMIQLSEQILEQTDDTKIRNNLLRHKGELHFVLQQFTQAAETYEQIAEPDQKTLLRMRLCNKYAQIKPDDADLLSGLELAELIAKPNTVSLGNAVFLYYYHIEHKTEISPQDHLPVVGIMLARLNEIRQGTIPKLKLTEGPEGFHLDMSRTPYSIYNVRAPSHWRVNVLEHLNLYSLDISHTPISLINEMRGLRVKKLRMVGTAVSPASRLRRRLVDSGVDQVTLGKGDYSWSVINDIERNGIEVIMEEY